MSTLTQRSEAPLPVAVQESAATVAGGQLYVIGGYDSAGASTSGVYVFDGAHWADGPALPEMVNHPAAASLAGTVYVAGGFTASGATNRMFALVPGATRWQVVAPMRRARGALVLLAVGSSLYAIGGNDGGAQVAVPEVFDPTSGAWRDLPAMPQPRNHAAGFVDGSLACVAGGRVPGTSPAVDCLDTATSVWLVEPSMPVATSGAAAGLLGGGIVVVAGGEPFPETSLVPIVQSLGVRGNPASQASPASGSPGSRAGSPESSPAVEGSAPMLVPRHGTGYALFNGRLWMCGGATAPGIHATSTCTSIG